MQRYYENNFADDLFEKYSWLVIRKPLSKKWKKSYFFLIKNENYQGVQDSLVSESN